MNTPKLILATGVRLSLCLAAAFWCCTSSADSLLFGSAGKIVSYDTLTGNLNFSATSSLQNIFALSSDGHLVGTDVLGTTLVEANAGDGTYFSSFTVDSSISTLAQVGNREFLGAGNTAYGLATSSLSLVWSRSMGSSVTSLTSQASSPVFAGTANGSLNSLDAASGAINYIFSSSSNSAINAISLGHSGQAFFGDAAGYLYSIDAVKGNLNFSHFGGAAINQVASNNVSIFISDSNGRISSLNAATGANEFEYSTGSSLTQLALGANGSLFAAGLDGTIYALNASTGNLIGTFALGAAAKQLTLGGDGNLYALAGNTIYQVNSSTLGLVQAFASSSAINSFALAPVPEPKSWALLLAGLAISGLAVKRRHATRC